MTSKILNRLWQQYLMPDRIAEFEQELRYLRSKDYTFHTLSDFANLANNNSTQLQGLHCVIRIDVDSDPLYCLVMADTLMRAAVPATFYFRLSTLDKSVMNSLHEAGFEVGYHFEEIATFAKAHRILTRDEVLERIDEPRKLFVDNYIKFSEYFGIQTDTVASHGDFANRKLGLTNSILVNNDVRQKLGIKAEAYDESIVRLFDVSIMDTAPPQYWGPISPSQSGSDNVHADHIIRMLIHPGKWKRSPYWSTRQNIDRLWEGLMYR